MAAVSDTSPINYLALIGQIHILPALFERIIIPSAVAAELQHPNTPAGVRTWLATSPAWLEIRAPATVDPTLVLGAGEVQAISLALEIGAVPFLADDAQARRAGAERGLKVVGTVAILAAATRRGSLDFDEAVNRLGRTNFRAAPAVFAEVRRRLAEGESKPG
ncbi:MAG TPA: hypothetical protein VH120_00225 [Gemmataceae bacterium]|nr:hypothetical protein [Gemmataceae bacterium]